MNQHQAATGAENPDEVLTTEQVEELCGVSKRTLLKWRRTGVLPAECLPRNIPRTRRLRWPAAELRRFAAGATEGVDHA